MKKLALSMCLLPILGVTVMNAQVSKNGGISQEMLQQIVKTQPQSSADRALVNAIAGNKIDDLNICFRPRPNIPGSGEIVFGL